MLSKGIMGLIWVGLENTDEFARLGVFLIIQVFFLKTVVEVSWKYYLFIPSVTSVRKSKLKNGTNQL